MTRDDVDMKKVEASVLDDASDTDPTAPRAGDAEGTKSGETPEPADSDDSIDDAIEDATTVEAEEVDDDADARDDAELDPASARIQELENELAAARAESGGHYSEYLRTLAEVENVRKRSAREVEERSRLSREAVLRAFLAAVDDVERALTAIGETDEADAARSIADGVQLIHARLLEVLAQHGVKPMGVLGAEFDPQIHEAVMSIDSEDVDADHIAQVLQTGYWIGERVLRPARVAVVRDGGNGS